MPAQEIPPGPMELGDAPAAGDRVNAVSGAQRMSMKRLRPSVQPSFRRPSLKAAMRAGDSGSSAAQLMSTPIRRTRPAWAHTRSGHAAALPRAPSAATNVKRQVHTLCTSPASCLDARARGGGDEKSSADPM
jgi:hypothetical protein